MFAEIIICISRCQLIVVVVSGQEFVSFDTKIEVLNNVSFHLLLQNDHARSGFYQPNTSPRTFYGQRFCIDLIKLFGLDMRELSSRHANPRLSYHNVDVPVRSISIVRRIFQSGDIEGAKRHPRLAYDHVRVMKGILSDTR